MRAFKQLLRRLDDLHGMPFGQLAPKVNVKWNPKGPASNKSFAGDVVHSALGETRNSSRRRDLGPFGLEVKTIPLDLDCKIREKTKICALNFQELLDDPWRASHVYQKMRTTLFVPVVKRTKTEWRDWYMWGSFIWLPTEDDDSQMEFDYEVTRTMVREDRADALSGKPHPKGPCKILLPNTGGKDSHQRQRFMLDGLEKQAKTRSWFLDDGFTQKLVDVNLEYTPLVSADGRI